MNPLDAIAAERRDMQDRPLLLLGHSLGGLVVKPVLTNAQQNPKYESIKLATKGLASFSTPSYCPDWPLLDFGQAEKNFRQLTERIATYIEFPNGHHVVETSNLRLFSWT
jgi:hypothetical protein